MRALKKVAVCIAMVVAASAAMSQDFIAFEGKHAIREGEGGAKKTVEGVDFWSDGDPPRKFKLLGYITDRRQKSGLIGMASMAGLEKDVAAVAKKNGGDAVILMNSEAETIGAVGMANGTARTFGHTTTGSGFGMSAGVQKQNSKFAVLKYMPDADVQPVPAAPASAAPADHAKTDAVNSQPSAASGVAAETKPQ